MSVDAHSLTRNQLAGGAWTIVGVQDLGHTPELLLESGWTADELRAAIVEQRLHFPGGAQLVVVTLDAPAAVVVAALEAGADACVRGNEPAVVRAHLSALYRRRQQLALAS